MALVPDSKKHFVKFIRKDVGKFKVLTHQSRLSIIIYEISFRHVARLASAPVGFGFDRRRLG